MNVQMIKLRTMSVPIIYKTNENGVVIHPTKVWEWGNFDITVGSTDGYFWASGSHGMLSTQGWGSPVSCSMYWNLFTSREEAALKEARFVYNQLSRITDGTKKDEPKIKEALLKLESAFPELRRGSIRVNLAVLATML